MNWIPKVCEIEISENYFDGRIDACTTATARHWWTGKKIYKWLWFKFSREMKEGNGFDIIDGTLCFDELPDKGVKICVTTSNIKDLF
jgi:hypothetical protein